MTDEKGTPEKRVQMHNTPPQRGSWIWLNRDDVDAPKVKPGDHVTVEAFGRWVSGTVTRCDEDGITIHEEPPETPYTDPCSTCRIRDHWCCDPWENHFDHEGDTP